MASTVPTTEHALPNNGGAVAYTIPPSSNPQTLIFSIGGTRENHNEIADDIKAGGELLWPIVILLVAIFYKTEIRGILRRVRKLEVFGQSAELDRELNELQATSEQAKAEIAETSPRAESPPVGSRSTELVSTETREKSYTETHNSNQVIEDILRETSNSPRVGLILLAGELEKYLRLLIGNPSGTIQATRLIQFLPSIPPSAKRAFRIFWNIRSRLVHGEDVTQDEIIRAVDSGVSLLGVLKHSRGLGTVLDTVDLFSDVELQLPLGDTKGVIISSLTRRSGGVEEIEKELWPTYKSYRRNQLVDLEWDTSRSIKTAWYREPKTGMTTTSDWIEAAYFVGDSVGNAGR